MRQSIALGDVRVQRHCDWYQNFNNFKSRMTQLQAKQFLLVIKLAFHLFYSTFYFTCDPCITRCLRLLCNSVKSGWCSQVTTYFHWKHIFSVSFTDTELKYLSHCQGCCCYFRGVSSLLLIFHSHHWKTFCLSNQLIMSGYLSWLLGLCSNWQPAWLFIY